MTEDSLIARIVARLPEGRATLLGPGDDAALVAAPDGRVVVSTDVLVEGRHFRRAWSTGYDVGWRAAVQNLADVAAMGARPTALVVALVLPSDVPATWVEALADGLAAAAGDVGVVGGDLSGGTELAVSVTVLGDLAGRPPVLRSGARAGDVVAHAGVRGRSAAGLAVLEAGLVGYGDLVAAYLRPVCPLEAGPTASEAGATAMMDLSDGLLKDAGRLAAASGVALDLDDPAQAFPGDLAVLADAAGELGVDARTWVLTGGEDHGVLATFPPGAELPAGYDVVGRVLGGPAGRVTVAGADVPGPTGWDHFAGQPRR